MTTDAETTLFPAAVHNSGLFSSHWLEHRLELEPEWRDLKDEAESVLERLAEQWKTQRNRVERYGDEQGLEEGFIQPVLRELGWKLKYQTSLKGREPDYALFLDDAALDAALAVDRHSADFWVPAKVVADAKAWHVALDRPVKVQNKREYPPEQIEWYLDRSRLDWGILTNGRSWRLIPRELGPQQRRFQTYLEADLPKILNDWTSPTKDLEEHAWILRDFQRFYLFFSPAGFTDSVQRKALVRRAAEGSSEYRLGVSEGLKGQAFEALRLCIEGFLAYAPNGLDGSKDLLTCREQSFILLYRLLFILFAEDRRLLPYKINRLYTDNRSLGRLRDEVAQKLERARQTTNLDYERTSVALWQDLESLFDLIDSGHARYGVPAYNGGLFDDEAHPFLTSKKLSDWHLARVIDCLGRAADPDKPAAGLFRVDYRDLAIQHLGGIYEGLLELHPRLASERMLVYAGRVKGVRKELVKAESVTAPPGFSRTDIAYPPGSVYLITDKEERRAFGSYYTPDHVVDFIVRETLRPLCQVVSDGLQREVEACQERLAEAAGPEKEALAETLSRLQQEYPERVLRLRVLDPAMGSSHFLLRACQFLAEEIATHPFTATGPGAESDESALSFWKRRVVESCLYGVDVNPLAVELAKLALWLETVAANRPLTFLDHHLRHGNSLIGAKVGQIGGLPGDQGLYKEAFDKELASKLPAFLEPLREIRQSASENVDQVKHKILSFAAFSKAVGPFRLMADVWCAAVVGAEIEPQSYHDALALVDKPGRFKKAAEADGLPTAVRKAREELACFHWELEFPEAFFGDDGPSVRGGFDAVIGNPPYEVLSELESGQNLDALRAFIDAEPTYAPSLRGKNNLYKLFICRALALLAEGGRLGFITPMAVLGDDQAADLRREIVRVGSLTAVEAFPQKDDPARRVFREAKLSTAAFVLEKGRPTADRPFRARVHPAQVIEEESPGLTLTTASIPLYDPSNFTIVSCDQADWDLATRIVQSGRLGRLKPFAEFFQGEVNETNERARGNLTTIDRKGKLVTRGAGICLYVVRPASQGEDLLLNVESFLRGKGADTKAFHHRYRRIGLQESSPQNNFRRIIAAMIPAGEFCNHKINYLPEHTSKHPLEFALGLLNSKLSDWYFRLGSTNAAVSHYQLYNLPCPLIAGKLSPREAKIQEQMEAALTAGLPDEALDLLRPLLAEPPFSPAVQNAIIAAVQRIMALEAERGAIARTDRSALNPAAQPYQDFIDQLFYGMAGLTSDEVKALEERYEKML